MRILAAGAAAMVLLTSVVPPGAATASGAALLGQRSRGRGRGGGTPADARSLLRGRVLSVDAATGVVALDGGGTVLETTLPPARLVNMKPGDVVFISVDLIDTRIATIAASVTAVDTDTGTLVVATPRGALTVTSSPEAIAAIKPGDRVLLKLDVVDLGPPFEPSPPATGGPPKSDTEH